MSIPAKLALLESYEADGHRFLSRMFNDSEGDALQWREVFVFRKPEASSG